MKFAAFDRAQGWVCDCGYGGTFSWDVDEAKWWDRASDALVELQASAIIGSFAEASVLDARAAPNLTKIYIVRVK